MKGRTHITLLLMAVSLLAASCVNEKQREAFAAREDVRLEVGGKTMFESSWDNCQYAFNRDRRTFRAQDDEMRDYYVVQFDNLPLIVGEQVKASVKWTDYNGMGQKNNVTLTVLRIEGDKVWLRDANGQIALTVRILE